ncbi:hypothetical protein GA0070616_3765 [Micromonospora nigra]|uniref:Uncharacterized protein n=1 Tax=Micromonospora nigra TaxID=145857 RepID=A0A1C6SHU4_9ACTN|nr:hypothetical protein [Micromonospora nigra]SCL28809.1 hypothetical protein GA0070616_3765 [Micromonospora nigra]
MPHDRFPHARSRAYRAVRAARRRVPRHRPGPAHDPVPPTGTRSAERRTARARQRRRWAAEGTLALLCVAALVAYAASTGPDEPTGDPGGVPAEAGPPGLPVLPSRDTSAGLVSPGLQPRERSPSPSPTPASPSPVPHLLTLSHADVPARVDLTARGGRDWLHFGLRGAGATVRKRDGSGEIRDDGGSGDRAAWDANQETVGWRDGVPVRSVAETTTGVFTCGVGSGFALAVTADGQPRTAQVYLGVWMAGGRLAARLSTGGPTRTVRLSEPHTSRSAEVTVRFQAPPGARLVLTWIAEETHSPDCGAVTLQAVALR